MRQFFLLAAIAFVVMPSSAGAQQRSTSDNLIRLYLGKDAALTSPKLLEVSERIDQLSATEPLRRRSFMLVFSSEIPISEFAALCSQHDLDLNSTRFEIPLSTGLTKTIEMREYLSYDGTVEEVIAHRLGWFREMSVRAAANHSPPSKRATEELEAVAAIDSGVGVWSAEVVATYGQIAAMRSEEPRLFAALDTIEDMTAVRDKVKAMAKRPLLPIGILDDPANPRVRIHKSTSPRSELRATEPIQSILASVSGALGSIFGATPAWAMSVFDCGPGNSFPNATCPPVVTWLPDPILSLPGASNEFGGEAACFTPSPGSSVNIVGFTNSNLTWSDIFSPAEINLWSYTNPGTAHCNPSFGGVNGSFPCGGFTPESDVIYIDKSSYEDDIVIDDSATCNQLFRDGTVLDTIWGCKYPDSMASTLPSAYLDTTASDGPNEFIPAVGTIDPEDLSGGSTYNSQILFWGGGGCPGLPQGTQATHRGQVGVRVVDFLPPEFSVFSTKTTNMETLTWTP